MSNYRDDPKFLQLTIANGATASNAKELKFRTICGVFWPSAFTGATIKFQTSPDLGTTWYDVVVDPTGTTTYTVTKALDKYTALNITNFSGVGYFRAVSASSEAADRTIIVAVRNVG